MSKACLSYIRPTGDHRSHWVISDLNCEHLFVFEVCVQVGVGVTKGKLQDT